MIQLSNENAFLHHNIFLLNNKIIFIPGVAGSLLFFDQIENTFLIKNGIFDNQSVFYMIHFISFIFEFAPL